MKKVGIITLSGFFNYGNRLQNYALQRAITKLGYNVETIWNEDCYKKQKLMMNVKHLISTVLAKFKFTNRKQYIDRYRNFKKFNNKYIINYKKNMYINNIPKDLGEQFDYFVVGSDQIWNYSMIKISGKEFLSFAPKAKNIAYAPSLGVSKVEKKWEQFYKENLENINYLSCREKEGAKIIEELTERKCEVVLDPTLLLEKEEWQKVEKKPSEVTSRKYILLYFLGEKNNSLYENIKEYGLKNNLEIIDISDKNSKYYICGPSEFLYLINHAELVFTNSFHACVFSIIYEKNFYVFDRKNKSEKSMSSRIETLLNTFELNERYLKDFNIKNTKINYKKCNKIIEDARKKSIEFLKKALCRKSDNYE